MSTTIKPQRPWRTAGAAGMASYLDAGAIISTGLALVLYQDALGLDATDIGLVSGLLTLCIAVGALFGGRLGDRFGRRRVFTITLVIYLVGILVMAAADSSLMLFLGAVPLGLAVGADLPVSLALISEEAPLGKKGKMVAFSQFLWLLGVTVTAALSIAFSTMGPLGGRILYLHLAVVAVVVLIVRSTVRESAEWTAARQADVGGVGSTTYRQFRQLFSRPVFSAVVATGLYYGLWNLGANTLAQYTPYLFVNVAGSTVQLASLVGLAGMPIGLVLAIVFMRVVDTKARQGWFIAGTAISLLGFTVAVVLGGTTGAMIALSLLIGVGGAFSGEGIYKVWSQEHIPTLLRSTAQGTTLAFGRILAAGFAMITPLIAIYNPSILFALLLAFSAGAAVIGLFVIPRLPLASQIEEPKVLVVDEKNTSRVDEGSAVDSEQVGQTRG